MFLCGSRVFDFIENPHDWDFIRWSDENIWEVYKKIHSLYKPPSDAKIDVFKWDRRPGREWTVDNFSVIIFWDNRINRYADTTAIKDKNLFKVLLTDFLNTFITTEKNPKILYRTEILLEFLENDFRFNPDDEQKALINDLHDCKINIDKYIKECLLRLKLI